MGIAHGDLVSIIPSTLVFVDPSAVASEDRRVVDQKLCKLDLRRLGVVPREQAIELFGVGVVEEACRKLERQP